MSRNRNRAKIHQSPKSSIPKPKATPPIESKKEASNPLGISFVVSTEAVYLPSGGQFYDNDSPVSGLEFLEMKAVTAKEEDILVNSSYIEQGTVFDHLLDSLILTPGVTSRDLLDCDKIALLINARKTGYGNTVNFDVTCGECSTQHKFQVNLSDLLERVKENKYSISNGEEWSYDPISSTLLTRLPVSEIDVRIRLLSKKDIDYMDSDKRQKEKHNLPYNETVEFLRAVLVSANEVSDKTSLNNLVEILPGADARRIKYVHNSNIPKFDTTTNVVCPNCSAETEEEVPFSVGWFWSIK